MAFKDFFSEKSSAYKKYRPDYPEELFTFLASLAGGREIAWDCATGSGQCAHGLTPFFEKIIATDGSANQIGNVTPHPAIEYRVMLAERTAFAPESFDLITVGQALHWFDTVAFFNEAKRVLKSSGVLAVWTYNLLEISGELDQVINDFYSKDLASYWPVERKHVEARYSTIDFPFQHTQPRLFRMEKHWSFQQLLGYILSWSAVKRYLCQHGERGIDLFSEKLAVAWGDREQKQTITWPLTVYTARKKQMKTM